MPSLTEEKARQRLEHVRNHLLHGFNVGSAISNINAGTGSRSGCLLTLKNHALASTIEAWFGQRDIQLTKAWAYNSALLDFMYATENPSTHSPGARVLALLMPLISDHQLLIDRYAHFDQAFDTVRRESPVTMDFLAYQSLLALRGDWEQLTARCGKVSAHPPGTAKLQKYLLDQRFYAALADSDKSSMEGTLADLVSAKYLRGRQNDESGFTEGLVSTHAIVYAKIARRHGHELHIDSPLVPKEWLPVMPLSSYEARYPFMEGSAA